MVGGAWVLCLKVGGGFAVLGLRKEEGEHSGMGRPWWWAMTTDFEERGTKVIALMMFRSY